MEQLILKNIRLHTFMDFHDLLSEDDWIPQSFRNASENDDKFRMREFWYDPTGCFFHLLVYTLHYEDCGPTHFEQHLIDEDRLQISIPFGR